MKIKKLYKANNLYMRYVVQKCNGEYASFLCTPFREVKEDELKKMPFFTPVGDNAEEAEEYMYKFYGFEKELEFKTILEESGMNMKRFSEYFGIPYRTVQGWKAGNRECPDYLLKLMAYKLEKERAESQHT